MTTANTTIELTDEQLETVLTCLSVRLDRMARMYYESENNSNPAIPAFYKNQCEHIMNAERAIWKALGKEYD